MKKVNLLVASSLLASLLNSSNILTAQGQSYSSALLTDSSSVAADSAESSAKSTSAASSAPAGSAAAASSAPASSDSVSTPASAPDSSTTSSAPASSSSSSSSSCASCESAVSGAAGSTSAGAGSTVGAMTGAGSASVSGAPGQEPLKLSPAAMCPSPSFPFSFGPDGKAALNALPGSMNKAAASTFLRLLKEHLLTPSGLLSLAMNRAPGTTPSDFLMRSGKFDGLLMILSFIGSKVELSDSQIEQLQKIRNKLLDKSAPINADLTVLERKFRDQLIAPELDDKTMRSLRRQIGRDKEKLDALMTEHMIATSHVFTAEQRQKVRDLFMRMQAGPMGIKRPQEKKTTGD